MAGKINVVPSAPRELASWRKAQRKPTQITLASVLYEICGTQAEFDPFSQGNEDYKVPGEFMPAIGKRLRQMKAEEEERERQRQRT